MTTARAPRAVHASSLRAILTLTAAAVVAVALNAVVASVAVALGAPASYAPLTLPVYSGFTIAAVVLGWIGWRIVTRRAARPRRTLSILVPAVAVLSFIPDIALLILGFIPGTTAAAVIALMVMHIVVIAIAVPAYAFLSRD